MRQYTIAMRVIINTSLHSYVKECVVLEHNSLKRKEAYLTVTETTPSWCRYNLKGN